MHCDNIGGVNSMLWCCRMLGAGGCPLAVYHGEVDPLIPCGESATTETKPRSLCLSVSVARALSLFLCTLSAASVCVYVAVSASASRLSVSLLTIKPKRPIQTRRRTGIGEQIAEWHSEGVESRGRGREERWLTSFRTHPGDDHGVTFAGEVVRDFIATRLSL